MSAPTIQDYVRAVRRMVGDCHVNDPLARVVEYCDSRLDPQARDKMGTVARRRYVEAIRRVHRDNREFVRKFRLLDLTEMPDVDYWSFPHTPPRKPTEGE